MSGHGSDAARPRADQGAGLQGPAPEGVLRPLPRAHAHAASPTGSTRSCGCSTSLYAWTFFRARGSDAREGPGDRAGDPRAEPLLVHGPLLRRRVHPPARALHGEVAAVRAADAVHLHARRRVPGAARLPGRGGVPHRERDPRARRRDRHVLRGRPLAHGHAVRAAQARDRAAGAASPARPSCRSRSTAPRTCATGSGRSSRRCASATATRSAGRRSPTPRATSSRPWRTRSSRGSSTLYATLDD